MSGEQVPHKTVLVTGGAGSVGRELALLLAARGHRVRVFDLPGCDFGPLEASMKPGFWLRNPVSESSTPSFLAGTSEIVTGDITDPDAVRDAAAGVDAAVHLAAILPPNSERSREVTWAVNVQGTAHLVDALAEQSPAARLVLSSSVCVYGDTRAAPPPVRVTSPLRASDVYAETKIEAERLVRASSLDHTVLRISGVSVPAFLAPPAVWPFRPGQRIEFVCRDDVVAALAACVDNERAASQVYNVAGGPTWRMLGREYVARFNAVMGLPPEEAAYDEGAGYFDWYDTDDAQAALGYQRTSFERFIELLDAAIEAALSE